MVDGDDEVSATASLRRLSLQLRLRHHRDQRREADFSPVVLFFFIQCLHKKNENEQRWVLGVLCVGLDWGMESERWEIGGDWGFKTVAGGGLVGIGVGGEIWVNDLLFTAAEAEEIAYSTFEIVFFPNFRLWLFVQKLDVSSSVYPFLDSFDWDA